MKPDRENSCNASLSRSEPFWVGLEKDSDQWNWIRYDWEKSDNRTFIRTPLNYAGTLNFYIY